MNQSYKDTADTYDTGLDQCILEKAWTISE